MLFVVEAGVAGVVAADVVVLPVGVLGDVEPAHAHLFTRKEHVFNGQKRSINHKVS